MHELEQRHRSHWLSKLLVSTLGAFLFNAALGTSFAQAATQQPINITVQMVVDEFGPPGNINNLTALPGSTSGTVQLKWTAPGDDGFTGTAQGYVIKVSTQQITTALFNSASTYTPTPPWTPLVGGMAEGTNGDRVVSGLQIGVTYYFAIKAYDEYNQQGNWISVLDNPAYNFSNFSLPSDGSLTPPTNFAGAALSTTTIHWTWDPVPGASFYSLNDFPSGAPILQTTNTYATESSFNPNTAFSRTIRSGNAFGLSSPSSAITIYTLSAIPANVLLSTVGFSTLNVNWTANGNPLGTQYRVERSPDGTNFNPVQLTTSLTFADSGLTPLTTYYYRVLALNGDGIPAGPSNVVSTTTLAQLDFIPPTQPGGLKGSLDATGQAYTLIWDPVVSNQDGSTCTDLTGYNVYRRITPTGAPVKLTPVPIGVAAFADNVAGITYYYTVTAVDTSNNESAASLIADSSPDVNVIYIGPDGQSSVVMPDSVNSLLQATHNPYGVTLSVNLNEQPVPNNTEIVRHVRLYLLRTDTNVALSDLSFAAPQSIISIAYSAALAGSAAGLSSDVTASAATPNQLSMYWHNGVTWVKVGGTLDLVSQTIKTKSSFLGDYQLRINPKASSLTLNQGNVYPRLFTPNGDGLNDRVYFIFENPNNAAVQGEILDLSGRHIAYLTSAGATGIGTTLIWNGKDDSGSTVPSGAYMYKIQGEGKTFTGTVAVGR